MTKAELIDKMKDFPDKPNFFQNLIINKFDDKRIWKGNAKGKAARLFKMSDFIILFIVGVCIHLLLNAYKEG